MKSCIYDFETLSQDVFTAPVVNLAILVFDESRFLTNPYTFDDLVDSCRLVKFDVEEQVKKYNRKIQKSSLEWWGSLGPHGKKMLLPSEDDVSIESLYDILANEIGMQDFDRVYTRGNTFDPILLKSVLETFGKEDPSKWWVIRDTRSLFEGMTYGHNIKSTFIPDELKESFIAHDPCHDVAMDVMRFQYLVRLINDA